VNFSKVFKRIYIHFKEYIDMERVEATIAAAEKAVPWVSGPVGAEGN